MCSCFCKNSFHYQDGQYRKTQAKNDTEQEINIINNRRSDRICRHKLKNIRPHGSVILFLRSVFIRSIFIRSKFIRSFFIRSFLYSCKIYTVIFYTVNIYTDQNLYGSKLILVKIYTVKLYIMEAYSHCVHCKPVLWRSHVTVEQLQLRNYTVNQSWSRRPYRLRLRRLLRF
jgi:hypothetical protein